LVDLPALAAPEQYRGITLCTVIGAQMGEKPSSRRRRTSSRVWCRVVVGGRDDDDVRRRRGPAVPRTVGRYRPSRTRRR